MLVGQNYNHRHAVNSGGSRICEKGGPGIQIPRFRARKSAKIGQKNKNRPKKGGAAADSAPPPPLDLCESFWYDVRQDCISSSELSQQSFSKSQSWPAGKHSPDAHCSFPSPQVPSGTGTGTSQFSNKASSTAKPHSVGTGSSNFASRTIWGRWQKSGNIRWLLHCTLNYI